MMNGKFVIDVSYHNGNINWKELKKSGVFGVIIRCGYGNNTKSQDDKMFISNIENAIKYNFKVGVYLYSYAENESMALSEAQHTIRLISRYKDKLYYPVFIDLEEERGSKKAKEIATVFCEELKKLGYKVGVYANAFWWSKYLKGLNKYTKWVARYGLNNGKVNGEVGQECSIWQYTDKGKVNGIKGYVDLNLDFASAKGTTTKDINKIVNDVINGKYGNGEERKKKLTKLGYNYKEIQTLVNKKLGK